MTRHLASQPMHGGSHLTFRDVAQIFTLCGNLIKHLPLCSNMIKCSPMCVVIWYNPVQKELKLWNVSQNLGAHCTPEVHHRCKAISKKKTLPVRRYRVQNLYAETIPFSSIFFFHTFSGTFSCTSLNSIAHKMHTFFKYKSMCVKPVHRYYIRYHIQKLYWSNISYQP